MDRRTAPTLHYVCIGGRDMKAGAVNVRLHHGGPQGAKPKGEVVPEILASIKERRLNAGVTHFQTDLR